MTNMTREYISEGTSFSEKIVIMVSTMIMVTVNSKILLFFSKAPKMANNGRPIRRITLKIWPKVGRVIELVNSPPLMPIKNKADKVIVMVTNKGKVDNGFKSPIIG